MSTRCQIGFYEPGEKDLNNFQALIYRHWDGYPESVIEDIVPILVEFDKARGLNDIEYASAWLVAKLKTEVTNIGISNQFHGDIEYFYAIYPNTIAVHKVCNSDPKKWNKIKVIKLRESEYIVSASDKEEVIIATDEKEAMEKFIKNLEIRVEEKV